MISDAKEYYKSSEEIRLKVNKFLESSLESSKNMPIVFNGACLAALMLVEKHVLGDKI